MRVFLVRHGRTSLNAAGLLRGQLDVPLDETGEAEAAALGKVFRHVPLAVVVSSPLRRALDTARHISSGSNSPAWSTIGYETASAASGPGRLSTRSKNDSVPLTPPLGWSRGKTSNHGRAPLSSTRSELTRRRTEALPVLLS